MTMSYYRLAPPCPAVAHERLLLLVTAIMSKYSPPMNLSEQLKLGLCPTDKLNVGQTGDVDSAGGQLNISILNVTFPPHLLSKYNKDKKKLKLGLTVSCLVFKYSCIVCSLWQQSLDFSSDISIDAYFLINFKPIMTH